MEYFPQESGNEGRQEGVGGKEEGGGSREEGGGSREEGGYGRRPGEEGRRRWEDVRIEDVKREEEEEEVDLTFVQVAGVLQEAISNNSFIRDNFPKYMIKNSEITDPFWATVATQLSNLLQVGRVRRRVREGGGKGEVPSVYFFSGPGVHIYGGGRMEKTLSGLGTPFGLASVLDGQRHLELFFGFGFCLSCVF
jgi:hypothetical protein